MSQEINFQKTLKKERAYLHFEDGPTFKGHLNLGPKETGPIWGEAAFTTGMSGYQETLTDPSFLGQHIIFTTSHVGNYPIDERVFQSKHCHGASVIARHLSYNQLWDKINRPLFTGVDTRALTRYISSTTKSHKSVITFSPTPPSAHEFQKASLLCNDLDRVGQKVPETIIQGSNPIAIINYGIKQSIVEKLKDLNLPLMSFSHLQNAEEILAHSPRLIFLSNGPGDPRDYHFQIEQVKKFLSSKTPVRGICLGHQLISLALGAKVIRLPFGQRGVNHPVIDLNSGDLLITSQNHGYATDLKSFLEIANNNFLAKAVTVVHQSLFDQSIEGISSLDHQIKSVQFHPEAGPGPSDGHVFFKEIENYLKNPALAPLQPEKFHPYIDVTKGVKKAIPYKKVLLIGSGPIKIGQASEFDYSGTQALKALKSIGIEVVLVNSNPATIMTDPDMAARTYIEPITVDTVKKIAKSENIDAVISTMGGQTALNLCVELEKENFFEKNSIALLGASGSTITKTEDRDLFAKEMEILGYKAGKRFRAHNTQEALTLAQETVHFPLIIRRDFALGGHGAALINSLEELKTAFTTDLKFPITMETSLVGHKEIELEVMVDKEKNGVIICSIENVDPCGIHTGDSITVAPAQTISDRCYQNLRTMALTIAKHMGVVAGGANVQFAINPQDEDDITVIEMNPRVSRSSALASKATGYPIAKISALLAVGHTLKEILNDITRVSPVAFEPTLDYVAVKIPIFPFNKFPTSSRILGPQMRSVGEVLALGGSFNEAFFKALRSLELGLEIPSLEQLNTTPVLPDKEYYCERLKKPQELSLLAALDALRKEVSAQEIHHIYPLDPWFISQMEIFLEAENSVKASSDFFTSKDEFVALKACGFSDKHLAYLKNVSQEEIFKFRLKHQIFPVYKAVDTCSGEFKAQTPYFYSTYQDQNEARALSHDHRSVVVMGSGPNRIGQGIEFDYSCVKSCAHLRKKSIKAIMANSNPETVSTDYDSSDRLYLCPLYSEDITDILHNEKPEGVIASFSGQTGIKIRQRLEKGFRHQYFQWNFLGPSMDVLEATEDRSLFTALTKQTSLAHTKTLEAKGHKQLINAMIEIGPPVIIRPSYVIGGESMYIFNSPSDIEQLPEQLLDQLKNSNISFQVENYLEDAIEYDVDLVRDQKGHCAFALCEHIEHAGVHSGDSGMITPAVLLSSTLYKEMKEISQELANKLNIVGPINFQYAVKDQKIYCIEANPRGSRTLPFLSKAYNLDLAALATEAMLGQEIKPWSLSNSPYFSVKQSTFPFDRFIQDNIVLGPKMRSTGETMGIDCDKEIAVLKSYRGNYPKLTEIGRIMISLPERYKSLLLPYLKPLHQKGYEFAATEGTCEFIRRQGLPCAMANKLKEGESAHAHPLLAIIKDERTKMVFNIPMNNGRSKSDGETIRNAAVQYGIPCFTRGENIKAVVEAIIGHQAEEMNPLCLQEMHEEFGV